MEDVRRTGQGISANGDLGLLGGVGDAGLAFASKLFFRQLELKAQCSLSRAQACNK